MKSPLPRRCEPVDLNLFRVFQTVMDHRSVAAASRELGVSPSAVSHALARLRKLLDDDLFLPGNDGMTPTPRAIELAPNIADGLANIARVLETRSFDPAGSLRTFRIAASELSGALILPGLLKLLSVGAPRASLRVAPLGRLDIVQQLDDGRLDLVIGWFDALPAQVRRQTLFRQHEAMVVRAGHPLTEQPLTRQRLLAYPHIVVEYTGSEQPLDDGFLDDRGMLRRIWIERLLMETNSRGDGGVGRIAATVPSFAVIGPVLASTDLVATLPLILARDAAARDGLVILDLPYAPLEVAVEMVWHERTETDPGLRWLLRQISDVAREIEDRAPDERRSSPA